MVDNKMLVTFTRVVTHLSSLPTAPTSLAKTSKWSSKETLLMAEMFGNISVTGNNGEIGVLYVAQSEKLSRVWQEMAVQRCLTSTNISRWPVSQSVSPPSRSVSISALFKLQSKLNNSRIVTRTITIFLFCLSPVLNSRFLTKVITRIESSQIPADIFTENSVYILWEKNSIL